MSVAEAAARARMDLEEQAEAHALALADAEAERARVRAAKEAQSGSAAVVKEQKWLQEDLHGESLANWDYRVKVEPWTVFGQVHVHLMGSAMQLQHGYGGTAPIGGSAFTVALDPVPLGDDSMFEISGFGIPGADPEFSCSNLHKVRTVGRRQSRTGHVSRLKESCVSLWRRTTTRRAVQWDCTSD